MSDLVILTCSGLSNRLKPILSGLRIARRTGRRLRVVWNERQAVSGLEVGAPESDWNEYVSIPMPCAWGDLFARKLTTTNEICDEYCLPEGEYRIPRESSGTLVVKYTWRLLRFEDEPDLDFLERARLSPAEESVANEVIEGISELVPTAEIQSRIALFIAENGIGGDTIGLHVRRKHPYCQSIAVSQFITAARKALEANAARSVFLATDDPETEDIFSREFGSLLAVYPKRSRDRSLHVGIEDALIDMSILSRARCIIATCGSTFGEMAWWLGGCRANNRYVAPEPKQNT